MTKRSSTAVLHVGQNGQITIPNEFRKEHALSRGGTVMAVTMGEALVLAPHDAVLESICIRLEEAMKGAGVSLEDLQAQALIEREKIVEERYLSQQPASKAPKRQFSSPKTKRPARKNTG